jgi:hypothetical protein
MASDQWQTTIAVNPDGSKLFLGWYDRRKDASSNSLIQTYGVIEFRINNGYTFSHPR